MNTSLKGTDGGMDVQPQGVEEATGLRLEELDAAGLKKHEHIIQHMRFNALDTDKDRTLRQMRESRASVLSPEYLGGSTHGGLFLVMDGEEAVGFIALRVASGKKVGTIERILLAEKHHQEDVLQEILKSAEREMRNRGCTEGVITDEKISHDMTIVGKLTQTTNFYRFSESNGNDQPKASLEKAV